MRLTRFQGASAISSADYYGRDESGGEQGFDSGMVNRLSLQARDELGQIKSAAVQAGQKLGGMAMRLMQDM